jgi:hypothetical protein
LPRATTPPTYQQKTARRIFSGGLFGRGSSKPFDVVAFSSSEHCRDAGNERVDEKGRGYRTVRSPHRLAGSVGWSRRTTLMTQWFDAIYRLTNAAFEVEQVACRPRQAARDQLK